MWADATVAVCLVACRAFWFGSCFTFQNGTMRVTFQLLFVVCFFTCHGLSQIACMLSSFRDWCRLDAMKYERDDKNIVPSQRETLERQTGEKITGYLGMRDVTSFSLWKGFIGNAKCANRHISSTVSEKYLLTAHKKAATAILRNKLTTNI